jgi:hypothetical protein
LNEAERLGLEEMGHNLNASDLLFPALRPEKHVAIRIPQVIEKISDIEMKNRAE